MSRNISGGLKGRNNMLNEPPHPGPLPRGGEGVNVPPLQGGEVWIGSFTWGFTPGCNIAGFRPCRRELVESWKLSVERARMLAEGAEKFGSTVLCCLCGLLFGCPRSKFRVCGSGFRVGPGSRGRSPHQ